MSYSFGTRLAGNLGLISALILGRDWFLVPIKVGDDEGCEDLQKKVDELKKKMDVSIPIRVVEHQAMPWAAHGTVCYGSGGITVPSKEIVPELREKSDVQIAILAHEIAHIKHNDGAWMYLIGAVTMVVLFAFSWMVCPPAWGFTAEWVMVIPILTIIFARSRMQEHAADVEACKYLNNSQKDAISTWIESLRLTRLAYRNAPNLSLFQKIWRKFLISSEGDSLLGRFTHPTLKSRVEYFRSQIKSDPKTSIFRRWIPSLNLPFSG